jgi:hypothetical protein
MQEKQNTHVNQKECTTTMEGIQIEGHKDNPETQTEIQPTTTTQGDPPTGTAFVGCHH